MKLLLVAAAALFDREGRVLLARRPAGKPMAGLWEFPGGKIEPGENPEAALCRELREELGIRLAEAALQPMQFASHAYEDFHLLMPVFESTEWEGDAVAKEGQVLEWVAPGALLDRPAPAADIPLFRFIRDRNAAARAKGRA